MFGFQGIQLDGYHYCCPTLYLRNPQNQMLHYSSHLQKTGYSVFVGWEWAGQAVLAFSSIPSHVYFIAAEMCSPVKSCMSCRAHWSREAGPPTGPLFFVFLHFPCISGCKILIRGHLSEQFCISPDSLLLLEVVMHGSHSSHPSLSRSLCNSIWILSGCQGPSFVPSAPLRVQTMHQEVIAYLIPKYVSNINVWFGLVWFGCLLVVCLFACGLFVGLLVRMYACMVFVSVLC